MASFSNSVTFSFYLLCFLFLSTPQLSLSTDIHDLLPSYGLPRGLIPDNVESYTISPSGSFSITLTDICEVQIMDKVLFLREIKGQIGYGAVRDLSGVLLVQPVGLVPLTAIEADNEAITFYIGGISKTYPIEPFNNVPVCLNLASSLVTSKLGLDLKM